MKAEPPLIHAAFHAQVAKTPHAVCLINADDNTVLTYQETQRHVLLLAHELHQSSGVTLESIVAIYMEPSIHYIISMLAILTAGGAYLPLEVAYPVSMLQNVLQDARPVCVLTTLSHKMRLPSDAASATASTQLRVLCIDDRQHETNCYIQNDINNQLLWNMAQSWPQPNLDNLAFVVYSSGTTGQPKGICNPHRAPAVSYEWRFGLADYNTGDDVCACNVFFVWECLRPLMRGGAVLPITSDVLLDADQLGELIQTFKVTEMLFTPSLFENLLTTLDDLQRLDSLRTVFLNGEVVTMTLRARCLEKLPHIRFINLYSISECHEVGAVPLTDIAKTTASKYCPVGPPACSVLILDEDQQPVSNGEAGELYVSGDMLARGYLNLPELTASRFLPNPFEPNGIMYRTGDRARLLENGHLEILGRCDFMVKIRGYSVVLGAVEAALMEAVCLLSCVVVADGEEGEDKHLVAYIVRDTAPKEQEERLTGWVIDGRTGACPEIRHAVDGLLPHYMVPSVFIETETLPVSTVGAKLDRKALQAQTADRRTMLRSLQLNTETHAHHAAATATPRAGESEAASFKSLVKYLRLPPTAPMQDVESTMILLWELVLDKEPGVITAESDFQEQGGHSLSAARLAALVNKVFSGVKISAVQLFRDNTTVRELCQQVVAAGAVESSPTDENSSKDQSQGSDKGWSVVEASSGDDEKILQQVRDDAVLPADFVMPQSAGTVTTLKDARSIFLTGATGFLGVHLLVEILDKNESATVLCLARSKDPQVIKKNLDKYGLTADLSRIVLVNGDLSLPLFGMNQAEWNRFASTVDMVCHCGAAVSLTASYNALQPANVNGTLTAIRLAAECHCALIYISTNGIFPTDKGADEVFMENNDIACLPDRLGASNGYGLTKWAAERLVSEAHSHGLPTLTMRFGNIGWHSSSAKGNPLDYQGMLLDGCVRMNQRPNVSGWQFEVTPVDFAASAIVALAGDHKVLMDGSIFNCVQDSFTSSAQVFDWMAETNGLSIPAVSLGVWKQSVEDAAAGPSDKKMTALFAFSSGLEETYLTSMAYLDCSKLDAALARVEPSLKRKDLVSRDYFARFFAKAHAVPFTITTHDDAPGAVPIDPLASDRPTGPLAGQVAVVTGASSGIGRAIVQSLVAAGCHVAMGARRLSELEKTRKLVAESCRGSACKTVVMSTDVTKLDQVGALVERAESALGPVDILVNVAGVMYFTLMKNVLWDQWERTVDVNCKGTMYGIGTVLPKMLERGKGHIVNITSDAGRKSFPGLGIYSGSKFFVEAVSQALRAETASTGLRVTCIQPGNVETPLLSTSTDPEGLKEYGEPTGAKVLEPADIGRAVVYALSQPEWCAVNEILVEPREEPA